jgi:hypothetical protein
MLLKYIASLFKTCQHKRMTIAELMNLAGGDKKLAQAISKNTKPPKGTFEAIRHWPKRGIPQRHWLLVAKLAGVEVDVVAGAVMGIMGG